MRSEHKTTAAEWDLTHYGKRRYCYLNRPGVAKQIKRMSHRLDRLQIRAKINEQMNEYEDICTAELED